MGALTEDIAEVAARLPCPGQLSDQRSAAASAFLRDGLPEKSAENWRYTDISGLADAGLQFTVAPTQTAATLAALPLEGDRIVFVNGVLEEAQTRIAAESAPQLSVLGADWSALQAGFPRFAEVLEHPLGQLNTATAQHGAVLRTSPGTAYPNTLNIVLAHWGDAPLALQPRIVLDLAENSSARVVLHYLSDGGGAAWTNAVVEISQARGSSLDLLQLQEHGPAHTQTVLISAALARDASVSIASFDLGASLARNDIDVRLGGPGSSAQVFGAFLPIDSQHIDSHIRIDHAAPDTQSGTRFRGIAGARSRGIFNGKVIVRPGSQRISAEQRSDNLLLAPDAEIDTKPELEIYADDVKCSHGATVGELDEEHLFYLRSRGVDADAARALLTFAFIQTIVEEIADPELRRHIGSRVAARLPEHERWESLI